MSSQSAFVGRHRAASLLRAAVRGAHEARGSLVLLAGDAGIGKTALVSHVASEAAEVLDLVAWGRAIDGLGSPAYWLWTQVLRQLGVLAAGEHLGEAAAPQSGDPGDERFRLFERVVTALDDAGREGGLLVVLDDLHWADADSLDLLELVGRSLEGRRVAVIGTYRDTEAREALERLASTADVLTVEGLAPTATAELMRQLAGDEVSDDDASRMHRRTGGNPFFIRELSRLSQLRSEAGQQGDPVEVVDSVRDVIERRLARLSQPCARLLVAAAMDGSVVRPWALHEVLDDGSDVSALTEEATAQRILSAESGSVRFSHDLFREVIVAGIPPSARRQTHLALARALESGRQEGRPVYAAELAAQFAAAAAPGDPATAAQALVYAREAARDSTRRLAFDDATAHLAGALEALDVTGPAPRTRLDLLLELAAAELAAGRSQQAATTYRDAWSLATNIGNPAGQARAALGLHAVGIKTGPSSERDAQAAILEIALAGVEGVDASLVCELRAALARTLYHSMEAGRMARARAIAEENLDAAREHGSEAILVAALRARHDVLWGPGTAAHRLAVLDELERLVGPDDLGSRLLRAQALLELGDPASHVLVDGVSHEAELTGRPAARWLSASRRAASALLAGRLDEATARIEEAEQLAGQLGDDDAQWIADIQRWELARFAGGRGDFVRHRPDGEPRVEHWPPWQALVLAEAGRGDEAAAILEGFHVAEAHGPGVNAGYDLWFPAIAAEAAARCGSHRLRGELFDMLAPHSGTQVGCGAWVAYSGPVDWYLADLAYGLGDTATGAIHLRAAEEQCLRLGAPLWLRRVRETPSLHERPAASANSFARRGPAWMLTFDGVEAVIPDAAGLRAIAMLVAQPHRSLSAADLAGTAAPDRGEPVLDRRAVASYRARIADLEDEIADADTNHDLDRAAKARLEHEALVDELRRTLGHHGRARRLGDDSERVRKMIRARVHRAIVLIAEHHPQLAEHLRDSIETGSWCTYRPSEPHTWTVVT